MNADAPVPPLGASPSDPASEPPSLTPLAHVVDDDPLSRKHLRTVLAFHGYRVHESSNAERARTALLDSPPDVVLLDLQMPGENGFELLSWMRQQPSLAQVPAICVTASVPPTDRDRVLAFGFAQFVPKPITPVQRLLDALHAALGNRHSSR